ncbi:MAG: GNAT family N-acetyltransferase [Chloroflexota bacterium]
MDIRPLTLDDCSAWSDLLAVSFARQPAQMTALLHHFYGERQLVAWGAWDGANLAAQYSCLLTQIHIPGFDMPQTVGMSINMAVHPNYRGRGLIKHVSQPVYQEVFERGGIAGVGFSNAEGVKVDKRSKGYGYQVVGKMSTSFAWIKPLRPKSRGSLMLSSTWPNDLLPKPANNKSVCFAHSPENLAQRFGTHPFRSYQFGVQKAKQGVKGVVVYRPFSRWGVKGVSLLTAYGADLCSLLEQWRRALAREHVRFVHFVSSPHAALSQTMRQLTWCFPLVASKTPYFLTAKPLNKATPPDLFKFEQWDCVGGDIL